jgi:hypothetical protein
MARQTDNPVDENGYPVYGTFRQLTKQQTAVEWLLENLPKSVKIKLTNESISEYIQIREKAMEIEKEQIVNAHLDGQSLISCKDEYAEQYYNETYNK